MKPWEGQKPFDDISGGKRSSKLSSRSRTLKQSKEKRRERRASDVSEDIPIRQKSKHDNQVNVSPKMGDRLIDKDNPKR